MGFQQLLNGVVNIGSEFVSGEATEYEDVFVSTIVYNQLPIVDANIFNPETQNPLLQAENGAGISGIVKTWYNITRMMALAASLVILVYVAIKIILSSTGQSKAKYTELLKDWLLSLLLIFSLHYIMAAILFCSDAIVDFFKNVVNSGGATFSYEQLQSEAGSWSNGMNALIYSIIWIAFLATTFIFLILYIKRLILICFFVIISPIIVLLNTINKIRGKGADLLGDWLKQLIANVVMQPVDALLFTVVLSGISFCLIEPKQPLVALAFLIGYLPLRNWVLKFFGQNPEQNSQDAAKGMVGKGLTTIGKVGVGAAAVASNVSKIPQLNKGNTSNVAAIANRVGNAKANLNTSKSVTKTNSYDPNKGFQGGYAELSPEMLERANAEMTGNTNEASSYSTNEAKANLYANGANKENQSIASKRSSKGLKTISQGIGIGTRAVGAVVPKLVGAGVGVTAMALNAGAGNGIKGFKGAMDATETIVKAPGKFIKENGGIKSIGSTAVATAQYFKDRAANSYIMTGEQGSYQKQLDVQQAWENEFDYMQDRFIATATEEQMAEFSSASNKQEYIMEQTRQIVRSDPRYGNALEVHKGNVAKTDNYILQKQKASWKNGQKKSANNRTVVEHTPERKVEYVQTENSGSTVVNEQVYSRPEERVEYVQTSSSGSSVVHEHKPEEQVQYVQVEDSGSRVVYGQGNSTTTQTVEHVEEKTSVQQDLEDFLMDKRTDDLAYELITTMGEGHPLYEEFNRVSSESSRKGIARQFLLELAQKEYSPRDLTDIIRSKNHQELQKLLKK